jgi:hypothetical protein
MLYLTQVMLFTLLLLCCCSVWTVTGSSDTELAAILKLYSDSTARNIALQQEADDLRARLEELASSVQGDSSSSCDSNDLSGFVSSLPDLAYTSDMIRPPKVRDGPPTSLRTVTTLPQVSSCLEPRPRSELDKLAVYDRTTLGMSHSEHISLEQIVRFQRVGHLALRGVFPEIAQIKQRIIEAGNIRELAFNEQTIVAMDCYRPSGDLTVEEGRKLIQECLDTNIELGLCDENDAVKQIRACDVPYYQAIHLHKVDEEIDKAVRSEYFGRIATSLLGSMQTRLYQTALFTKTGSHTSEHPVDTETVEHMNTNTAWHNDLNQVPVDTNMYVTFWCPLQEMTANMSTLTYASGSHIDYSLKWWFAPTVTSLSRYPQVRYDNLTIGDCVAHHGWTQHMAKKNHANTTRLAFAMSYVDGLAWKLAGDDRRSFRPFEKEDELSYMDWFDSVKEVYPLLTPHLPVVYPLDEHGVPLVQDSVFGTIDEREVHGEVPKLY